MRPVLRSGTGRTCLCDSKYGMAEESIAGRTDEQQVAPAVVAGPRTRFLGYGACALAGCLWGTGFYFGRLALDEMSVEYMVLYRFLFACVGMLPVMLLNR